MKFDMHYFLTAKYARAFVISLIALFSFLILMEFVHYFSSSYTGNVVNVPNVVAIKEQGSVQSIINSSLFGTYVPESLNENSVKRSRLNLIIVGILLSDKAEDSQVIIRASVGGEKTYKVGDIIPGGVKIERITSDGVLVKHDGSIESLSLPKNDLIFEPAPKPMKEE